MQHIMRNFDQWGPVKVIHVHVPAAGLDGVLVVDNVASRTCDRWIAQGDRCQRASKPSGWPAGVWRRPCPAAAGGYSE